MSPSEYVRLEIQRAHVAAQDRTIGMESFIAHGPGKATFRGR